MLVFSIKTATNQDPNPDLIIIAPNLSTSEAIRYKLG